MATLRTNIIFKDVTKNGSEMEMRTTRRRMLAVRTQRVTRERRERRELCAAVGSKR